MPLRQHVPEDPIGPVWPGRESARVSVVVIDDRATNRSILVKLAGQLAEHTFVEAYADVRQALAAVLAQPPDLVVTDYRMPSINGAEFVRRLRESDTARDVPVIVVTAYEDKQFRYDALQAGASDFLLTPVDRLEFIQRGRNLLTMRQQQLQLKRQAEARERRLAVETRLRERELRFSEEKFRLVVNTLPALISAVDRDGRLAFVNTYHANFFGLDPSDAVGSALAEVAPADYADHHAEVNASVLETGRPVSFEEVVTLPGGDQEMLLTSKAPLRDAEGRVANVVTVSVDIGTQKRAEHELAAAKEIAQQANRAKTEFLANISHELRTPLNAILGFADISRRELLGPIGSARYRDYQEDIHSSASHLLALIDDLLDISTLELGRLQTKPEPMDIAVEVNHAIRAFETDAAKRGLDLSSEIAADVTSVVTDPVRFRQIIFNLLSNAVKYTNDGGRIEVTLNRAPDGGVRLTVSDDGPGMDEDEVETAMSRFGRLGNSTTQNHPGAGLGLPMARDVARLLGGDLTMHSTPGQGTRVVVDLPNGPAGDVASPNTLGGGVG